MKNYLIECTLADNTFLFLFLSSDFCSESPSAKERLILGFRADVFKTAEDKSAACAINRY